MPLMHSTIILTGSGMIFIHSRTILRTTMTEKSDNYTEHPSLKKLLLKIADKVDGKNR